MNRPAIDIVIPIYNAREYVQECIGSVLRHAQGEYRLILVDDASTDAELGAYLDRLARETPRIVLLRSSANGGFVRAANLGFHEAKGRDVVLLNSDTVVTPGFPSKLQECAYADEQTGIVTPFSNNATICSIPRFCEDNPLPDGLTLDEYAELISRSSLKRRPEIVTAVGFCMYVKASVFEQIGYFDEIYGRGFGEENDFCERAKRLGVKIRLCDDLFIAHKGKASFGLEGKALENRNMKVLLDRFPRYLEEVGRFCRENPLAELQQNIRYHLQKRQFVSYPGCLFLLHASPFKPDAGGAEHHVLDLVSSARFPRALIAYPEPRALIAAEILHGDIQHPLFHRFALEPEPVRVALTCEHTAEVLEEILDCFGIGLAHIHHLFHWPVSCWRLFVKRGIPFFYTVHDFYCVCPSNNLFNYATRTRCPCGPESARTAACLRAYRDAAGIDLQANVEGLMKHREEFSGLLSCAAAVFFPSRRALDLFHGHYPGLNIKSAVVPHGLEVPAGGPRGLHRGRGPLKAAVLGCVNHVLKGADNYLEIVRLTRQADIEWHFFGDLSTFDYKKRLRDAGRTDRLIFHGYYRRQEITSLLAQHGIDVVVMAPAVDETFSFTLSEALSAGTPVIATRMGSLEERLEAAGLPECLVDSPAAAAARVMEIARHPQIVDPVRERLRTFRHTTPAEAVQATLNVYGGPAATLFEKRDSLTYEQQARSFRTHWAAVVSAEPERLPIVRADCRHGPWWYRLALRFEEVTPIMIQRRLRRHFMAKRWDMLAIYTFSRRDGPAVMSQDVELLGWRFGCARFRSRGRDPYFVLAPQAIDSRRAQVARIRIRCKTDRAPCAQLFWVHDEAENFSEEKSIVIPLEPTHRWQDVIVDFYRSRAREKWAAGPRIARMRLDPLDCEGLFELDSLILARLR